MSLETEKLSSYLAQEISIFFSKKAELALPEGAFISVSRVELNDSMEIAFVYILVFPQTLSNEIFKGVKRLEKDARKYLAWHLKRRKIPNIVFKPDTALEKEISLEKLLEKI